MLAEPGGLRTAVLINERGEPVLDAHEEARAQLDLADRVVLTKLDLAAPDRLEALVERVRAQAPAAEILFSRPGRVPVQVVLLESAEHAVSPPRVLPAAPQGWSGSRLLLITRGLPEAASSRPPRRGRPQRGPGRATRPRLRNIGRTCTTTPPRPRRASGAPITMMGAGFIVNDRFGTGSGSLAVPRVRRVRGALARNVQGLDAATRSCAAASTKSGDRHHG